MSTSELMPHLELVPLEAIRFHEHPEHRRTLKLVARIKAEERLRNTPIVADMGSGEFLLLDGANRVSAFRELGYSHIPVQVVDYGDPRIQLKGWHHLLVDGRDLSLRQAYQALEGTQLEVVAPNRLSRALELREVFAVLVDEESTCWGIYPESPRETIEVHRRIATLEQVVGAYEGQSKLERIKLADFSQLPEVVRSVQHLLCLFPVLSKNELLQLARENVMIPTGLTRHLIPGRALGVNLELGFLSKKGSDEEKTAHFRAYLKSLEIEGRVRFYEESVFVLNE